MNAVGVLPKINVLGQLQKLGRALMLPIAVLPVAGLMLRLGSADLFDIAFIKLAGAAIFANLPLIFSIGVAVGISKDNAGAAALAGAVGYLVLVESVKAMDASSDMGVLAGMIAGIVAGITYNRFHQLKLPDWLAFFGGKRFVPIATAGEMLILALALGYIWPIAQQGIDAMGRWMMDSGAFGAFSYGTLNRLLIPTGLHQVINSLVWFVFGEYEGATGDLGRFFAGDPSAGSYMAGFYPVMIIGLPAACLAMYHCARPDRKKATAGLLFGVGLTSFVTGVTEPVEFLFMFLAPGLYLIHALLTGLAMALCWALDIKAGFTFSAGMIDFVMNFPLSQNAVMLLPIGMLWFLLYYGLFIFFIRKFDLKTPGREPLEISEQAMQNKTPNYQNEEWLQAIGGRDNITDIDSCITRLRLILKSNQNIDELKLKRLGAKGIVRLGQQNLQVIVGTQAENICANLRSVLGNKPQEEESSESTNTIIPESKLLLAPMSGELVALNDVPDQVFAQGLAGEGLAILPRASLVLAPMDGILEKIFKTNHAFALKADCGAEILVHIGIDTVQLQGRGFTRLAHEGQYIKKGEPIIELDLEFLETHAKSLISPVVITNFDQFQISYSKLSQVKAGVDLVMEVSPQTVKGKADGKRSIM